MICLLEIMLNVYVYVCMHVTVLSACMYVHYVSAVPAETQGGHETGGKIACEPPHERS